MEDFPPEFANVYCPRQLSLNQSGEFEDDFEAVTDTNEEVWVVGKSDNRKYIQMSTEDVDGQGVLTQAASYNDYHSSGYPHIGLLRMDFNDNIFCGTATMIADGRYLLTCAHNVVEYNKNTDQEPMYAKNIWFELRKNEACGAELSSLVKRYTIRDRVVHPEYSKIRVQRLGLTSLFAGLKCQKTTSILKLLHPLGSFLR